MRFTVRGMMAVVALTGVVLAPRLVAARRAEVARLKARYQAARDAHLDEALGLGGDPIAPPLRKLRDWHVALYRKYKRAAASPWLAVEPDPPRPPDPRRRPALGPIAPLSRPFDPPPTTPEPNELRADYVPDWPE